MQARDRATTFYGESFAAGERRNPTGAGGGGDPEVEPLPAPLAPVRPAVVEVVLVVVVDGVARLAVTVSRCPS